MFLRATLHFFLPPLSIRHACSPVLYLPTFCCLHQLAFFKWPQCFLDWHWKRANLISIGCSWAREVVNDSAIKKTSSFPLLPLFYLLSYICSLIRKSIILSLHHYTVVPVIFFMNELWNRADWLTAGIWKYSFSLESNYDDYHSTFCMLDT